MIQHVHRLIIGWMHLEIMILCITSPQERAQRNKSTCKALRDKKPVCVSRKLKVLLKVKFLSRHPIFHIKFPHTVALKKPKLVNPRSQGKTVPSPLSNEKNDESSGHESTKLSWPQIYDLFFFVQKRAGPETWRLSINLKNHTSTTREQ